MSTHRGITFLFLASFMLGGGFTLMNSAVAKDDSIKFKADFERAFQLELKDKYAEATAIYRRYAEDGHAHAQRLLGDSYVEGLGVEEDTTEGLRWYRTSARNGDTIAQQTLGNLHRLGRYLPKNFIEAYKWYDIAGRRGYDVPTRLKKLVIPELTTAEIAEAKKRADEWIKKYPGSMATDG